VVRPPTKEFCFYKSLIDGATRGCIIDVGANGGEKAEIFRRLASCVIAVEPDPTSADLLRKRFRWRPDVQVRQCAVADRAGTISF
jgi:FkbM family methyltransferase